MNGVQPLKFGDKYTLLDQIGVGGVAEVYRGKLSGGKGFEKLIVIKKLLPHQAADPEMVDVFIGEARLAALFQHENIAATYDFGEIDGEYFLAMEYLFGKNLHAVMARARAHPGHFGLEHGLAIAAKICEGMDYAHNLKDLRNRPLNIIHRDLTPHNIFVTYDGKVKILDFGVAKAELFDNKTREGVVKGKISYMSPERLSGEEVDRRSDIFSIGIMLYEMIAGRRMYQGDTAELIRQCIAVEYERLDDIMPGLPAEVYAILDRALAAEPEQRYQSCAALQSDIEDLLLQRRRRSDARMLKASILALFEREYDVERQTASTVMQIDQDGVELPSPRPAAPPPGSGHDGPDRATARTVVLPSARLQRSRWHRAVAGLGGRLGPGLASLRARLARYRPGRLSLRARLGKYRPSPLQAAIGAGTAVCLLILITLVNKDDGPDPPAPTTVDGEVRAVDPGAGTVTERAGTGGSAAEETATGDGGAGEAGTAPDEPAQPLVAVGSEPAAAEKEAAEPAAPIAPDTAAAPGPPSGAADGAAETRAISGTMKVPVLEKRQMKKLVPLPGPELPVASPEPAAAEEVPATDDRVVDLGGQTLRFAGHSETERREEKIAALHGKAVAALRADRLLQPVQESAYGYYQEILRLDPADTAAADGLQVIADTFAGRSDEALEQRDFDRAEASVRAGLSVMPNYRRLLELRQRIGRQRAAYIAELLDTAEARLASDKLTTPAGDSAHFYYSEIFRIDPDNESVRQGFRAIADRYATLANDSFLSRDFDKAEVYVERGLQVAPDHYYLLSLQQDLAGSESDRFFRSLRKRFNNLLSQ